MSFLSNHTFKLKGFLLLLCLTGIGTIWTASKTSFQFSFYSFIQTICVGESCLQQNQSWFKQHFQEDVPPLLTSSYNLSQEDFDWWRRLQYDGHSITLFKKTTQRIFQMFPPFPPVPKPGPDHRRSCAVVGNSINLKGSHYGKIIDLHTFVFRINHGKTKGFEEDVGTRITHRAMYPESATSLDNSTHLVLFPFKIRDLQWLLNAFTAPSDTKSSATVKKTFPANKDLVMVVNPAFMKYVHQSWLQSKGQYPSTGFMVVILALHLCDEVSVFGFGADSDGNWSHYWETLMDKRLRTGPHPGSFEYDMILELAKHGRVTFYSG